MKVFKDSTNREWIITVNVGTAKAVRDLTGVDIFNLYDREAGRVFADPVLLVNVLYVLCKEQCEKRGLSDAQFGEALVGDCIEDAATKLLREVADFFPSSRRQILHKLLEKSEQAAKATEQRLMAELEGLDLTSIKPSAKSQE